MTQVSSNYLKRVIKVAEFYTRFFLIGRQGQARSPLAKLGVVEFVDPAYLMREISVAQLKVVEFVDSGRLQREISIATRDSQIRRP